MGEPMSGKLRQGRGIPILLAIAAFWLAGGMQGFQQLFRSDVGGLAGFPQRLAPAATVINSELFEYASGCRILHRHIAYSLV